MRVRVLVDLSAYSLVQPWFSSRVSFKKNRTLTWCSENGTRLGLKFTDMEPCCKCNFGFQLYNGSNSCLAFCCFGAGVRPEQRAMWCNCFCLNSLRCSRLLLIQRVFGKLVQPHVLT